MPHGFSNGSADPSIIGRAQRRNLTIDGQFLRADAGKLQSALKIAPFRSTKVIFTGDLERPLCRQARAIAETPL